MPVKIPNNLPAKEILTSENIFVMDEHRALHQDIRPLKLIILNLMPTKIITEIQLLRLLGNTALQVEIEFLHPKTHQSRNTPQTHLLQFYKTFDQVVGGRYDGMVITGAPVELMEFAEVDYWHELCEIFAWSKTNVTSTMHICWGAQAGLYYHYGIEKYPLKAKQFGIFKHFVLEKQYPLLRGFDNYFYAPHSRHTAVKLGDIKQVDELVPLAVSKRAGVYIVATTDGRQIFITGHAEYDPETLKSEYERDLHKGLDIALPENYYPNNDPNQKPIVTWRAHAHLLFANWLNYYVYQVTPYNLYENF